MPLSITPGMIEWNTDDILAFLEAKSQNVVSSEVFRALFDQRLQGYAFTVSRLADVEMIADVFEALEAWEKAGLSLGAFQESVEAIMDGAGWTRLSPWHVENILRTNMAVVYNNARYDYQMEAKDDLPYWLFSVIVDSRTTKEICLPLANPPVVLPANHRWFWTHMPPLHFQCRSEIIALANFMLNDLGYSVRKNAVGLPRVDVDRKHGFGFRRAWGDDEAIQRRIKTVKEAMRAA